MLMTQAAEQMTGSQAGGESSISLVIPCKAEYVALCRLVAGALGARESLDEELIADLKVVVTEACTCFLGGPEGCSLPESGAGAAERPPSLRMDFKVTPDVCEITVCDPDGRRRILPASLCDPMSEGGLGLTIIKALVDSVELTDSDTEGSTLRLVKRLSAGPVSAD
jgi:serine/threonine-protein kinase RsbW